MEIREFMKTLPEDVQTDLKHCSSFVEALDLLDEKNIPYSDYMTAGDYYNTAIVCPYCGSVHVVEISVNDQEIYKCQECQKTFRK